jgi:hypothetical protein
MNAFFKAAFFRIEARFLSDDPGHKNGIDVMFAGNLCNKVRIGNSWREKMSTQAPSHGLMDHPVQCATS